MASALEQLLTTLDDIHQNTKAVVAALKTAQEAEAFRVEFFGKKGRLTEVMKQLGTLPAEDRPKVGERANQVRAEIQSQLEAIVSTLNAAELATKLQADRIDVTLPGRVSRGLSPHPVHIVEDELVRIFEKCGFVVEMGPEAEHEFLNFDALNIPATHPARSSQDTFFVKGDVPVVLRTHTSPVQARTMLTQKPPIRMICPGRVYRADYDATHSPMFHQIEGLLVDKDVNMGDLKGILEIMVNEFFKVKLAVRLRPSFFPFTEPSAEIDMQCVFCQGKGCKTCKQSGWIEIGGCGMVDPEVFKACDVDHEKYRGFAFGMGLERMAMIKFGVNDLRAFFESDHKFIQQFSRWVSR